MKNRYGISGRGMRGLNVKMNQKQKVFDKAIAFDFDGTLLQGGLDKSVHVMYSSWMACFNTGYRIYLNPDNPARDVETMLSAYLNYPGSPRFQQLSAIVNALINGNPDSVIEIEDLNIDITLKMEYPKVKKLFNSIYSDLNSVAAEKYWKPFPVIKETLKTLSRTFDLYIASGVTEDILQNDFDHHHFDRSLFCGIYGGNNKGGSDKASIIKKIKQWGYKDILFIGDSTKDLEYAIEAGVNFFRIKENNDYLRLLSETGEDFPNEKKKWSFTEKDINFFKQKTHFLVGKENRDMSYQEIVDYINKRI
jgi:phosphoglycolate phosphatase-like HAD superfamily hydrolase